LLKNLEFHDVEKFGHNFGMWQCEVMDVWHNRELLMTIGNHSNTRPVREEMVLVDGQHGEEGSSFKVKEKLITTLS
jgi:hypothetical protein